MWKLMYNYDFGVFNQALTALGLSPVNWLGSTKVALAAVILVDIWHWVPFVFLILFAAVEGVPQDVIEAARIDGATSRQITWRVIVPLLKPALGVAVVFRSILAFRDVRRGLPADVGRTGNIDRTHQPAPVQGVLRAEPARATVRCFRWR
jgi:multiple sugar transport system permease protein